MTYEVHPVADLFPMLADDELAELAQDIRQRGLLHDVVLDADGRVLDGRNRLAACELAGVAPRFTTYEGGDPDGYALASNGQVRELTKSQKAVVGARLLISSSDSELEDQRVAAALRVPKSTLSEAIVVARHADLADRVLARVAPLPFSVALTEARDRDRRKVEDEKAKRRLQIDAADLLSLVDEERMTLADAIAVLDAREEKARQEEQERQAKLRARTNEGDEWYTPRWLFDALGIKFSLDVCAPLDLTHSSVPAEQHLTIEDDGLAQPWRGTVWCNPPYSEPEPWARRMIHHRDGLLLTHMPMNAGWCVDMWEICDAIRLFQAMEFVRPDGTSQRPGYWLQLAAFGPVATAALGRLQPLGQAAANKRRIASPMWRRAA